MRQRGWIGVDLDGTLAYYDGWKGVSHVGAPIKPMCDRVRRILDDDDYDVKVFTARVHGIVDEESERAIKGPIEEFCMEQFGRVLEITNVKDFAMVILYDDRAYRVEFNTGLIV